MENELCGCGNRAKYNLQKLDEDTPTWACNPTFRCMTYKELATQRGKEYRQLQKLKAKCRVLTEALERCDRAFSYVDNGYCSICRGHRLGKQPCENKACLSRQITSALKGE
jgi:hypothetical protein